VIRQSAENLGEWRQFSEKTVVRNTRDNRSLLPTLRVPTLRVPTASACDKIQYWDQVSTE
jgi:hypothetical protein